MRIRSFIRSPVLSGVVLASLLAPALSQAGFSVVDPVALNLVLAGGEEILTGHLGLDDEDGPWIAQELETLSYEEGKQEALKLFKRRFIERALSRTGGNVTHAADRCGLTRAAFQRIMRALDLDRNQFTN